MKWSFVISYLNGDYLDLVIKSICNQKNIKDNYEIITVGPKNDKVKKIEDKINKTIFFEENLIPSWITMKKNIGIQNATNDNVCILHEYVGLCENWYDGYVNFGNNWDVCMNSIRMSNGLRYRDWITLSRPIEFISYEDKSKTNNNMYISGTYWCAKKDFMLKNPLNIQLIWGQGEDIEWSVRCMSFWNYKFNPNSTVKLLKEKPKDDWNPNPAFDMNALSEYNQYKIQG